MTAQSDRSYLAYVLTRIVEHDTDYPYRNRLVLRALALAAENGYQAGIRIDPAEPEWPVAYIELPTGQVSWHLPQHTVPFDGHTTAEKHQRIARFAATVPPMTADRHGNHISGTVTGTVVQPGNIDGGLSL